MKIYISGPMTGLNDYNRTAFYDAENYLKSLGHTVFNPARLRVPNGDNEWCDYMRAATRELTWCDGVALLPGWRNSVGAKTEHAWATRVGLQVMPLSQWKKVTE